MQWLAALCVRRPVFATRAHPLADRRRRVRVHAARRRSLSRRSTSRPSSVTTRAAGRRARADRDRDHRQDRGSGQHDQRHRRAALDLVGGRLAGHRRRSCSRRTPTSRRRKCATRSTASLPLLPQTIQQPTVEKLDPDAAPVLTLAVSAPTSRSATSPSTPTRCCGASSRASTASARCSSLGGRAAPDQRLARRRSLRALQPDGHRRVARAAGAERRDPRRPRRAGRRSRSRCARAAASRSVAGVRRHRRPRDATAIRSCSRDVARVEDGMADADDASPTSTASRRCCCTIRRQSGTNTVEVVDAVKERLDELAGRRCRPATSVAHRPRPVGVHRGVDPQRRGAPRRRLDPRRARRAALPLATCARRSSPPSPSRPRSSRPSA